MATIAQSILDYYEHEDFRNNYAEHLLHDRSAAIDRIKDICKDKYGNVVDHYGDHIWLTEEQAEEIYEYIVDNIEEFTDTYRGYFGSPTAIDSISYGEQCEQLTGLWNPRTDKDYTLPYLRKAFADAGFYVDGEYAYMDLSSEGVMIDMFNADLPPLEKFIKKQQEDRETI